MSGVVGSGKVACDIGKPVCQLVISSVNMAELG